MVLQCPAWLSPTPPWQTSPPRPAVQLVPIRKAQQRSSSSAVRERKDIGMGREWEGDGKGPRDGGSGNGNGNERKKKAIDRRLT